MAYTLLNALNRVLKRATITSGPSGDLASLTDSARQTYIDTALQVINEGIHELYSLAETPLPIESDEANITLVAGQREYDLPTDLETIRYPLICEATGNFIIEYPGGYETMRAVQLQPQNWTGLPTWATINPTTGKLRMDVSPTATDAGKVYTLLYDKRLALTAASDTFPFSDTVVDCMVPAWKEMFCREQRNNYDQGLMTIAFGRAVRYLSKAPMRKQW